MLRFSTFTSGFLLRGSSAMMAAAGLLSLTFLLLSDITAHVISATAATPAPPQPPPPLMPLPLQLPPPQDWDGNRALLSTLATPTWVSPVVAVGGLIGGVGLVALALAIWLRRKAKARKVQVSRFHRDASDHEYSKECVTCTSTNHRCPNALKKGS